MGHRLAGCLAFLLLSHCVPPLRAAVSLTESPACAGDACAASVVDEPEDVLFEEQGEPTLLLFERWREAAAAVRPHLASVGNRSKLFDADIARLDETFAGMLRVHREGIALLEQAAREPDGYSEQLKLDASAAHLEVLVLGLRVTTLRLNYLLVADAAETAGVVSTHWQDALRTVARQTDPIMEALVGFDRARIESTAVAHAQNLAALEAALPRWESALRRGTQWSSRAIHVADAVTLTFAAYDLYRTLGAAGGGGPDLQFRFPGLVTMGAGGAAEATTVIVPAEVLESIRRLIEMGAISEAVLSAGMGPAAVKPDLVGGGFAMEAAPPPSGGSRPVAGGKGQGPGEWIKVNEKMSPRSTKYQTQINGRPPGWAYRANGVRFDDFNGRALIEAKGPGYAKFMKNGEFREWFRGDEALIEQAKRQSTAARGAPVEWHVAEPELASWLKRRLVEFKNISITHTLAAP